jgi:hypothetical protein
MAFDKPAHDGRPATEAQFLADLAVAMPSSRASRPLPDRIPRILTALQAQHLIVSIFSQGVGLRP